MKTKTLKFRDELMLLIHFLFWTISINAWNIVFNPAVQSSAPIKGMYDEFWGIIILWGFFFCLYSFSPFIWFFRKISKTVKISLSIVFFSITFLFLIKNIFPANEEGFYLDIIYYFIHNFFYVIVFHLTIGISTYFNVKHLIPLYLNKNLFGIYLLFFCGLIIFTALTNYALFDWIIDPVFPNLFYISYFKIWELIIIASSYLVLTSVIFLVWQFIYLLQKNREQTQNELSALKAQINPHFLFNNLNTIYSLASKNDKRTKDVVLQLSDFLRYVLYDAENKTISLKKEVETIETYVKLQKERVNPKITTITLKVEGDLNSVEISPLLLLPIAENCFKHGIGKKPGEIYISIRYNGKYLLFETENTIARRELKDEKKNGGIGLENVKKQLNLLYPGKHSFYTKENEGIYRVELKIELIKCNQINIE